MNLLQSYFKADDPRSAIIFGIVAAAALVILIIGRIIYVRVKRRKDKRAISVFAPKRRFRSQVLRRIAYDYSLSRDQKKLLDFVFKSEGTNDPERLLQNRDSLDRVFQNVIRAMEKSSRDEDAILAQVSNLFTLRNVLEQGLENSDDVASGSKSQRRFTRKQVHINCMVYLIRVKKETVGRKKVTRLIMDNKKGFRGNIQDISTGGCAISTVAPLEGAPTLRIDFTCSGMQVSVLGQVVRSNRSQSSGTVIHTKFVKIPRRAFIEINSMIFGYT